MSESVQSRIDLRVSGSESVDKAVVSLDRLAVANDEVVVSLKKSEKVREGVTAKLERQARAMDAEYRALRRAAEAQRVLDQARTLGLGSTTAYERALAGLQRQQDALAGSSSGMISRLSEWNRETNSITARMSRFSASVNDNSKAAGLARHEWTNLSRQIQDVLTMGAMGASPMQIISTQGAQFFDIFSSSSAGAGAALKDFGATALRVASHPVTMLAATFGTAAVAGYKWQQVTDALTVSMNGLGRASGLTAQQVEYAAATAARGSGISHNSARGLAAQYLGAGVPGRALGGAIGLTREFGHKLGLTNEEAATTLAGALADPAKGAEKLAEKFGLLSLAQRETIAQTAALGDRSGAASKLVAEVGRRLKELEDPTWNVSRAFERLKTTSLDFLSKVGRSFVDTPVENEFQRQARVAAAQRALERESLDRGILRQRGLDQIMQDAGLAAREITAQTYAQREAIIAERERAEILRNTLDITKATLSAEAERVRLLAQSQRAVDDYVRAGQQERSLLGKRPLDRRLQEIDNRFADLMRQLPQGGAGAAALPSVRSEGARRTDALLAEASKRGLEPTESTFDMLMREGVGKDAFRGRLLSGASAMSTAVDLRKTSGSDLVNRALRDHKEMRTAIIDETLEAPLRDANRELDAQAKLLDVQRGALFRSTEETARLTKAQELHNQIGALFIDQKKIGKDALDRLNASIEATAEKYGRLTAAQEKVVEQQRRINESIGQVRDIAGRAIEGFVNDLDRGTSVGKAFRNTLEEIRRTALQIGARSLTDSLFGQSGSKDSGILGGLIKGGASALGGIFGGGKSTGYFEGGALFSGSPFTFGFANGGVMTSMGPVPLRRYANGGIANSMQMAIFAEGSRPEAYVPLPDGRSIPVTVDAAPAAQPAPASNVEVHNYAAGVQVTPKMTPHGVALIVREVATEIAAATVEANNLALPGILRELNRNRN